MAVDLEKYRIKTPESETAKPGGGIDLEKYRIAKKQSVQEQPTETQPIESKPALPIVGTLALPAQIGARALGRYGIGAPSEYIQTNVVAMGKISDRFLRLAHQESDKAKKLEYIKKSREALRGANTSLGMIEDLDEQIRRAENIYIPGLGTIPSVSEEPAEAIKQVAGRQLKTLGLTGGALLGPVAGGGIYGVGEALEEKESVTEALKTGAKYAVAGKVLSYGFGKVMPFATRLLEKAPPLVAKPIKFAGKVLGKAFEAISAKPAAKGTVGAQVDIAAKKFGEITEKAFSPSTYLSPIKRAGERAGLLRTPAEKLSLAEEKARKQIRDALNPNMKQSKIEAKSGKKIEDIMVREGLPLDSYKEGGKVKLDTSRAREALSLKADIENQAFKAVLKDSGEWISFDDYVEATRKSVTAQFSGVEREQALNLIEREMAAWREQVLSVAQADANGKMIIPADRFNDIKQYFWSRTRAFGTPEANVFNDVNYLAGRMGKLTIEQTIQDANIRAMNEYLGDLSYAKSILFQKQGSIVPGGAMGKYFARTLGGIIGSKFGPLGASVGAVTADQVAEYMMHPEFNAGRTQALIEELRKQLGTKADDVVSQAYKIIEQRAIERAARLKLAPSTTIFAPPYKGGEPKWYKSELLTQEERMAMGIAGPEQQMAERQTELKAIEHKRLVMSERQAMQEKMAKQKGAARPEIVRETIKSELSKNIPNAQSPEVQDIISELEAATAGKRELIKDASGAVVDVVRSPSTFPEWIPPRLRSQKLVDRIVGHIKGNTIPKRADTMETRLYDIVTKKIESMGEIDVEKLF